MVQFFPFPPVMMPLRQYTLAQAMAINPATLQASTPVRITDYGGTIAVSDGVRWRLNPLIIPFASRPAANAVPEGCGLFATDLNRAEFISDGTNWRPRGVQDIYHKNSLTAAPFATLTGVANGVFAIPDCKIPAGMLLPNSKLTIQAGIRKPTVAGAFVGSIYIGNTKSTSDQSVVSVNGSNIANVDVTMCGGAKIVSTTSFLQQNWSGEGSTQGSSSGVQIDRNGGGFNSSVDMYVSIGIGSASVSDNFLLTTLRVTYEA